ncbi:S-adenosylmethionine:tRNA ribosyltransferase-isomerase [Paractinoplanes abujensis]|uniref:S-adenosylmethionine:tRNA ribosyltransferase-isomerase n=1 Tax=Paractinoplanes abujensis TaxID=882441 RepID=A0A7W7FZZ3_9ACTN|nr:S-adenosylmethionine:tRNA ribosyltransferase-isomerase [Actinoplanes abujensis]MBB4691074.1 S-adenosylmethionine:tRNA ribosyltransferase-isomerase [Actinoplanes abujensis]GID17514.1 S-adenosylmethionine:tRNA ribosyltransferase-isomerase [Actinoplanes abujensis]
MTVTFSLPPALEARAPAEPRDGVRLMVSRGTSVSHHRFPELPSLLEPGDLLVVNNSGTLPAALQTSDGVRVHVSTSLPDGTWLIEPRDTGIARPGLRLPVPEGSLTLLRPFTSRLWVTAADVPGDRVSYLTRHGRAIRYSYTDRDWPIETYQNAYATVPGSAEMPSAGRPFTPAVLSALAGRGVLVAPITLHTGVASAEADEPPYPEWFRVPAPTARLIPHVRASGGRVIAVGTTVVRALETGTAEGWTDLVITPEHPIRTVDGLITGLHEPRASHLMMLTAVAGEEALRASYTAALRERYLWHEFGDVHLLLR